MKTQLNSILHMSQLNIEWASHLNPMVGFCVFDWITQTRSNTVCYNSEFDPR